MKLKLGKSTGQNENEYAYLAKYGYECADFQMANTDDDILYHCSEQEFVTRLKEIKGYADKYNINIHQMHGPWTWPPPEEKEENRERRFEEMSKSIYAASILGCKYWVVHPMMPYGTYDIHLDKIKETWDFNVEYFTRLLEVARKYDVTICIENMPMLNFSLATPGKIVELVETINDEHFMCCLDTGHVACFNNYPVGDAVRTMGKYLKVLHIHDNHGGDTHELPLFGRIDWDGFYKGLCDIDFDGVFNLETGVPGGLCKEAEELVAKALVIIAKQIMHEPLA